MAPKRRAKSRARGAKSASPEPEPTESPELTFLAGVTAASTKKDATKLVDLLGSAASQGEVELVQAACLAFERMCGAQDGFKVLMQASGVEALLSAAQLGPEAGGDAAARACEPLCAAAATWLQEVDAVDFTELEHLLNLARLLGSTDEDVAMSALGAIERFALHRREHALTMLQNGVLQVLHQFLGAHRSPELVEELLRVLFRLCDLPAEAIADPLAEEKELVASVVEALTHAPLNLRLQLTGLRLLALLARTGERPLCSAIAEADAQALLQKTVGDLGRAGLPHFSSWVSAVAGRTLAGASKTSE